MTPTFKPSFKMMFVTAVTVLSGLSSAHAGLSADALKVAMQIVRGGELTTAEKSTQVLTNALKKSVDSGLKDSFIALKPGGMVSFGIYEPAILLRRGLYTGMHMRSPNTTWISLVIERSAAEYAIVPGKAGDAKLQLTRQFSKVIDEIVAVNPLFKIASLEKRAIGAEKLYRLEFNVSLSHLEFYGPNTEEAVINGSTQLIYNIPIEATDSLQDVMTLINVLGSKFRIVTSLEG